MFDESCKYLLTIRYSTEAGIILQALLNEAASRGRTLIAKEKVQEWSIAEMARNYERVYKDVLEYQATMLGSSI